MEPKESPKNLSDEIKDPSVNYDPNAPKLPGQVDDKVKKEMDKTREKLEDFKKTVLKKFPFTLAMGIIPPQAADRFDDELGLTPEERKDKPMHLTVIIPEDNFKEIGKIRAEKGENEPRPFLSTVKHLINSHDLPKTIAETWKPLDATKFTLAEAYGVRAYFVGSDTSYNNSLGFNTSGQGVDGSPLLIFPNASTAVKFANADSRKLDSNLRTTSTPLFPGDFVDLGSGERGMLEKGTNLDFFLIRDGFNTQPKVGSAPDILSAASGNLVAFAQADNPYVLISFEDGSGSNDYSDTLFAIDMGANNVNALLSRGGAGNVAGVPAPEPGVIWALVLGAGTVLHRIRRKRTAVTTTSV